SNTKTGISACLSKTGISAKLPKGSTVSARFTGTFSIAIISCADEQSSITVTSMVTPSAAGKETKTATGKEGSFNGKGASKEEGIKEKKPMRLLLNPGT